VHDACHVSKCKPPLSVPKYVLEARAHHKLYELGRWKGGGGSGAKEVVELRLRGEVNLKLCCGALSTF